MTTTNLGKAVHSFFIDYLSVQKGLQTTSIQSYRDVMKLLLCFLADRRRRKVGRLTIDDLSLELVQEFLNHLEQKRGNHIRTRNRRLAVLHTFFEYIGRRAPEALEVCQQVAAIPTIRPIDTPRSRSSRRKPRCGPANQMTQRMANPAQEWSGKMTNNS